MQKTRLDLPRSKYPFYVIDLHVAWMYVTTATGK